MICEVCGKKTEVLYKCSLPILFEEEGFIDHRDIELCEECYYKCMILKAKKVGFDEETKFSFIKK